jgi:hypothetical protein
LLTSNLGSPTSILSLLIPVLHPGKWTHGSIYSLEPLAWHVVLSELIDTFLVVSIILPAMLGLVSVREASIKWSCGVFIKGSFDLLVI